MIPKKSVFCYALIILMTLVFINGCLKTTVSDPGIVYSSNDLGSLNGKLVSYTSPVSSKSARDNGSVHLCDPELCRGAWDGFGTILKTTLNSNGEFSFQGILPGRYDLSFDIGNNGVIDSRMIDVEISPGKVTALGILAVEETMASNDFWFNVIRDQTVYLSGETIPFTCFGYNGTAANLKVGYRIDAIIGQSIEKTVYSIPAGQSIQVSPGEGISSDRSLFWVVPDSWPSSSAKGAVITTITTVLDNGQYAGGIQQLMVDAAGENSTGGGGQNSQGEVNGSITKIVFLKTPSVGIKNLPYGQFKIQTQDQFSVPALVHSARIFSLSSTSAGGTFSVSRTTWSATDTITMAPGTSILTFYYMDSEASSATLTVSESPDLGWTDAAASTVIVDDPVLTYVDSNLEAGVRTVVSKPAGDIFRSDLYSATLVNLAGKSITTLEHISEFMNCTDLRINNNSISALTSLDGLEHITRIDAQNNSLTNVNGIENLTTITYLNLRYNLITDITALSSFQSLQSLYIRDNPLTDLAPLAGATDLKILELLNAQVIEVSALENLGNLNNVDLRNNGVTDIQPLVNNPGLGSGDILRLNGNPLGSAPQQALIQVLRDRGVNVYY